ncbi:stage II sporulation protein M [Mucilaginibacter auburnensis]|uniref:Putative membrane protein SpoIIM required for sporulation n=1 Tax=Mucilaginibacter auburnensis TaxID=1457233 RepID=A0A2H9VSN5_9SPHI|nr:stage II sporulation protein M [Mucilaginibacter auburnensis]PJJ83836.1 putative membrane protein SpoIIM required for sporulation [Mucilaginibacter auburnensis]
MREPLFVKQNATKWKSFEIEATNDPDELADRFIQITDDLAFAKTFYPDSKTTSYLNGLAARLHQSIYKNKTEKSNRFISFWKYELPILFYTYRRQLLYSFLFFFVFCMMGAFSAKYDDGFVRLILGDAYVDMTEANIAKNDPFAVYKQEGEFLMFLMIGGNNIYVALKAFVAGIFFSVGTVYALFYNGLMLGSFQYFFFSKNLGIASVLVIWIHGTLEISSIVIAGAAGLVLGNSILFPKTFSRLTSLKRGAKHGMQIAIGLVPIFIIAAFFEGFVTRHTEMPVWLSSSILGLSLLFIIWYVIIYPKKLSIKLNTETNEQ